MAQTKVSGAEIQGILATRAIPYDSSKTGSVTTIDTGMKFGTQSIWIYYRCFNATVSSPGTYSKITDVDFTSVFAASADTLKVVDMWINGRFESSKDFLINGTDVAAAQRLSCKLSYTTRNVEVWGMFGGASSANGVVGMLVVI